MASIQRLRTHFECVSGGRNNLTGATVLSTKMESDSEFISRLLVEAKLRTKFECVGSAYIRNGTGQSHRISAMTQKSVTEPMVMLFELDLTMYNLGIARFVSAISKKVSVKWGGEIYAPYPVEVTGFEWSGTGSPPRPTLRMSTAFPILTALIIGGNDLIGCKFRRIRTFERFLDDGAEPSTVDTFQLDEFRVERKVSHNKLMAEFELASVLDQQGVMLPRRQAVRDYCPWVYRRWDAVEQHFIVDESIPCPYSGDKYFDISGNPTTMDKDVCSKKLGACRKRYGVTETLPFGGFPGMSMVR